MARRTGVADLPLHGGHAPRWLFSRMVRLSRALVQVIVRDFGPEEVLKRLADPFWFQAFGCVLGFDWHSSGLTTTVCGALKEGLKPVALELGLFVCGGKARASRRTPEEIIAWAERAALPQDFAFLTQASRLAAKVDNTALQDGYQLYHHVFIFTKTGQWAVIQQGMNETNRYARRYHWLGSEVESFVLEPHSAIATQKREKEVLNFVARESLSAQKTLVKLAHRKPEENLQELAQVARLALPRRHGLAERDLLPKGLKKVLLKTYEERPANFEALLGVEGLGPKSLRALALLSELVYGEPVAKEDPARYAFAHGGKDGHPFPVDRKVYDQSIAYLEEILDKAKLNWQEKDKAFRRLHQLF